MEAVPLAVATAAAAAAGAETGVAAARGEEGQRKDEGLSYLHAAARR